MNCPSTIKVLGKPYSVTYVLEMEDDDVGDTDSSKQAINIAEGQAHEAERDTVLHEIIHAIDFAVAGEMTERQVHALAGGLLQVLRENPKLTKYLTEEKL
jgi:hypothetical protein